jgi:hypothetical protein
VERDFRYPGTADEPLIDPEIEGLERHRPAAPREGNAPSSRPERLRPPRPKLASPGRPEGHVDTPVTSAIALEEASEVER